MSGLSDSAETAWLKLLLQNVDWTLIGDAGGLRGSATAGSLYLSLHTADPTDGGDQSSSEIAYTNYARIPVARSTGAFSVTGDTGSNVAALDWPTAGASGGATATHVGIGTDLTGAGVLVAVGPIAAGGVAIALNVQPHINAGALQITAA